MRVIDEHGNQLGVIGRLEALQRAREAELDLVEISPNADPPVAKIVDWGKYNYQRTKQQQKAKRNQKTFEVKQIRFGLKISDHDLGVKLRKITEFLEEGHTVKVSAFYRGRELAHKDLGYKLLERIVSLLGDKATVDGTPQFAGKQLTITVRPNASVRASHQKAATEDAPRVVSFE